MLKMTKVLTKVLVAVMVIFSLSITAFASQIAFPNPTFENGISPNTKTISIKPNQKIGGGEVKVETDRSRKRAADTNTPPVAGLEYVVLNPESLINGQITTNTQIAWLWSYNGQNFTYDPDGDAITNISVGGIPADAIIGNMTGNIGFATQFSAAGQYVMTYQVEDARGALSNILKFIINIEPADGNTRPTCAVTYAPNDHVRLTHPLVISWDQSSDADAGDSITGARGLMFKNGSTTSTDLQKDVISSGASNVAVMIKEVGTYEIWISVSDTKGAWSDWAVFTIEVLSNKTQLSNINVSSYYGSDIVNSTTDAWWVDYQKSIDLAWSASHDPADAEWIVEQVRFKNYPPELYRDQIGTSLDVSGKLKYLDGTPASNETVTITMPMTRGAGLDASVVTDANGYFLYDLNPSNYWTSLGFKPVPPPFSGDFSGKYTQYAHYSDMGVLFSYNTTLTITNKNGGYWSGRYAAAAGVVSNQVIGAKYWNNTGFGGGDTNWVYYDMRQD